MEPPCRNGRDPSFFATAPSCRWPSASAAISQVIRASGCRVPTPALIDTLDHQEIEAWFAEGAATSLRLKTLIKRLAGLPDDTKVSLA